MKNKRLIEFLEAQDPEAEVEISVSKLGETKVLSLTEDRLVFQTAIILINAEYL